VRDEGDRAKKTEYERKERINIAIERDIFEKRDWMREISDNIVKSNCEMQEKVKKTR